jgi:hypothetical protein
MTKQIAVALAAALTTAPGSATAAPFDELQRAAAMFAEQTGVHTEEHFSNGQTVVVDYVGDDRTRVTLPNGTVQLVIGNQMWTQTNGRWAKLPPFVSGVVAGTVKKYRQSPLVGIDASSVKDLGMQQIGAKRAHAYAYSARDGSTITIWLGRDGLPVLSISKSGTVTTTVVYTYGHVAIDPPKGP